MKKADSDKPRMSLLPGWRALRHVVEVMHTANELQGYIPGSWRLVDPSKYRDAFARHVVQWLDDPQAKDPYTGKSHLAHAACCALILLWHGDHE